MIAIGTLFTGPGDDFDLRMTRLIEACKRQQKLLLAMAFKTCKSGYLTGADCAGQRFAPGRKHEIFIGKNDLIIQHGDEPPAP